MIREGHIGIYEMTALFILTISSRTFLSLPEGMVKVGQSAGWMVPIISALFTLPAYYLYYRLLVRFPGENIVTITERVWGRWLGALILTGYWANTIFITALVMREFTETFITVALPKTPISILLIVQISVISYASYLGLETIARTSFLILPWIVVSVVLILMGVTPYMRIEFLTPIWGSGISAMLKQGFLRSANFVEILLIGLFASSIRRVKDLLPLGIISILSSTLLFSLTTAAAIATVGPLGAAQYPYPLYNLARQIYFGRFFQRVEAIFIIVWFIAASGSLFVTLHAAVLIAARGLRLPFYQPLIFPTGVIVFAVALFPRSYAQARDWNASIERQYLGGAIIAMLVLTYLLAVIRKKRAGEHQRRDRRNGG